MVAMLIESENILFANYSLDYAFYFIGNDFTQIIINNISWIACDAKYLLYFYGGHFINATLHSITLNGNNKIIYGKILQYSSGYNYHITMTDSLFRIS